MRGEVTEKLGNIRGNSFSNYHKINLINSSIWRILVAVKYFYSFYYGGVSVGRGVSVGGGVSVGEGSGVSVGGGSSVGDAVYVLTETAVYVGGGCGVNVGFGGIKVDPLG